jgi:hypothetical protein
MARLAALMISRVRTAPKRVLALHVLVSDSERAEIRELALRERRTVSEVVRAAIERYRQEARAAQ